MEFPSRIILRSPCCAAPSPPSLPPRSWWRAPAGRPRWGRGRDWTGSPGRGGRTQRDESWPPPSPESPRQRRWSRRSNQRRRPRPLRAVGAGRILPGTGRQPGWSVVHIDHNEICFGFIIWIVPCKSHPEDLSGRSCSGEGLCEGVRSYDDVHQKLEEQFWNIIFKGIIFMSFSSL